MPEISVIIPVYNAEEYLEKTLNSVAKQTFKDFEVICIDDGSTDKSRRVLEEFAAKDERFKVFFQPNGGGSKSRNKGLYKAMGKYIAFIDNDDIYHPQYLEILYKNLQENGADVCSCSYVSFYGDDDYRFAEEYADILGVKFVSEQPFRDKFVKKAKIESLMWTKLYKAELLKNISFSEKLPAVNDMLFNIEVLLAASKVAVCDKKLIAYRLIETSQTRRKLSTARLDEYKNLAIEIMALTQKHKKEAKVLAKVAANYVYGMYVKEVKAKYSIDDEPELYARIYEDLAFLIKNKVMQLNRLGWRKRFEMWRFLKNKSKVCRIN